MGIVDVALIVIFGLFLPTYDVYTDLALAYVLLFKSKCKLTAISYLIKIGYVLGEYILDLVNLFMMTKNKA